jgi:3-hydroxybutyryl-CoA dehydrogenase
MKTNIKTAAVVGAGYMGGGIAQTLAFAGVDVQIADANPELTRKAFERLLDESEQFEREGLFKPGSTARLKEHLRPADSIESAVASVDFVEEAVPEVPAIKREVLGLVARAVG